MSRIICAPLSSSLTTLTAVSLHPVLSKSVKEFVYDCNRYELIKTRLEYKQEICEEDREIVVPGQLPPEDKYVDAAFSQYRQRYNDQSAIENSGEVIARLCSALMRMPNIKAIKISPEVCHFLDIPHLPKYFPRPLPAYDESFLLMARVISLTGAKIRELDIQEGHDDEEGLGVSEQLFRGMSYMDLNHCCDAFRSPRRFKIIGCNWNKGWTTANLAKILSAATDLESLTIEGNIQTLHISTKHISSTTIWSRLTFLHFSDVSFDQGELLDLLRRYSRPLKELWLGFVYLRNGSWKIFLEGMKSCLSLQAILIYELYEYDELYEYGDPLKIYMQPEALNDYLLGDGPHPLS